MATRQKTRKHSSSALSYIGLGIIIGLAIAAIGAYYMRSLDSNPTKKPTFPLPAQAPAPTQAPLSIAQKTAPLVTPTPKNDQIGNIIGQIEQSKHIKVPVTPTPLTTSVAKASSTFTAKPITPVTKPSPAPQNSPAKQATVETYLQVGSFKNRDDAEAKRGELILHGFTTINITKVTINNIEYNRVYLGPFTSEKEVKEMQGRLKEKNISTSIAR